MYFQKIGFDISYSPGDNLHEMLKPVFLENKENYFTVLSGEIFTQHAKC